MDECEMRPFIAAILIAALASPAYSQSRPSEVNGARAAAENAERSKAEDKAFTDAVKRIRPPEKKYDPWGVVREPKGAGGSLGAPFRSPAPR
jgi:hypothetical protein